MAGGYRVPYSRIAEIAESLYNMLQGRSEAIISERNEEKSKIYSSYGIRRGMAKIMSLHFLKQRKSSAGSSRAANGAALRREDREK